MKTPKQKLSPKKARAVIALLVNRTMAEAAQAVGIAESTLWRWMQDQDFQQAYREAKRQVVQQATAQMQANMSEAIQTLRHVMNDSEASASARVSAAKAMIEIGLKAVEIEDLEFRITILEGRVLTQNFYQ